MAEFTHLHLHTQYSLLDGAIRLDDLFPEGARARDEVGGHHRPRQPVRRARLLPEGQGARASSRSSAARPTSRPIATTRPSGVSNHLILLAKNKVGWKNLSYLNSMGYLEGFYYNPRIDKQLLREHAEGLIGLSACLGGEVAQTHDAARARGGRERGARVRRTSSGRGNFFLEMQPNGLEEQEKVNGHLIELSKKTGIPLVATNDCHYLNQTDARAHEILMCVQQKKTIHDEKRLHHRNDAFFVKTPAEMERLLQAHPGGAGERRARSASCATSSSSSGKTLPAQVPGARRLRRRHRTCSEVAERGPEEALRGGAPARRQGRRRRLRRAAGAGAGRHPEDGVLRLLPDRLGLHPLREGARHPGRAGPRLGRRLAGRVLHAHHRHRSDRATSCCSSASSTPSASRCRTSTSTSA